MIRTLYPLISALLLSPALFAANENQAWLPRELRIPGGIALVDITDHYAPGKVALHAGHPVKTVTRAGRQIAIVGIPLSVTADSITLSIHADNDGNKAEPLQQFFIEIGEGNYPQEQLTIADTNKVSPDQQSLRRIRRESKLISEFLENWQSGVVATGAMQLPTEGRLSSSFGRRRIINGLPRRPHSGLDIAAPVGHPVYSPADGVITGDGDYFFNGNSLFIDHGEGVISMFCHLDQTLVKPGDRVAKGALVARVGATGRVTGPHLHWSLSLNDARVDPLLFVENN
ncbi:MAG: peptidoglycan DD-metalloendopeptidase family protein [Gammaproteobacteria bacterium]